MPKLPTAFIATLLFAESISAQAKISGAPVNSAEVAMIAAEIGQRYRVGYLKPMLGEGASAYIQFEAIRGAYIGLSAESLAAKLTADL